MVIDLFKHNDNLKPQKGCLLVSEPFMEDDYFKRSVILLCDYNNEGAFGFILNNYITIKLDELLEGKFDFETDVSLGGPVASNNLYFIHTLGPDVLPGSTILLEGLYIGGDFEILKELLILGQVSSNQIKFFLGYSGWSANQLDEEMGENAWIVAEANLDEIMSDTDKDLWKKTLDKKGGKFKVISNFPNDPTLN